LIFLPALVMCLFSIDLAVEFPAFANAMMLLGVG
jgi:hypothetical protein